MTEQREQIEAFRALVERQHRERIAREYPGLDIAAADAAADADITRRSDYRVYVVPGRMYTKVDVGTSGKYMIEHATGAIFGIKAYGVVHKGHRYGTLDTIHEWDWSGYVGRKIGRAS
jgi:hypothetical protein